MASYCRLTLDCVNGSRQAGQQHLPLCLQSVHECVFCGFLCTCVYCVWVCFVQTCGGNENNIKERFTFYICVFNFKIYSFICYSCHPVLNTYYGKRKQNVKETLYIPLLFVLDNCSLPHMSLSLGTRNQKP